MTTTTDVAIADLKLARAAFELAYTELGYAAAAPVQPVNERWEAAIAERMQRGLSRVQAIQAIGREDAALWSEYNAASKPARRR